MPGELEGKVGLVTGGGRGIGRAVALGLAQAGAAVAVTARSRDELDAVAGEIEKAGGRALALPADLGDGDAPKAVVEATVAGLGGLDVLVNNAAIMAPWKRAETLTAREWDLLLAVNVKAPFLLAREAFPHLKGGGAIVNVASVAGLEATERMLPYSVTKAALIQLTKDLAREWAQHGIRVNAVAPGWTETSMTAGVRGNAQIHQALVDTIPMKRMGHATEIATVATFLASPRASYVTGAVFVADGGESL